MSASKSETPTVGCRGVQTNQSEKEWYNYMKNKRKRKFRIIRGRMENVRWHFWGYIMEHYPRFYKWADEHLPFDTLPF